MTNTRSRTPPTHRPPLARVCRCHASALPHRIYAPPSRPPLLRQSLLRRTPRGPGRLPRHLQVIPYSSVLPAGSLRRVRLPPRRRRRVPGFLRTSPAQGRLLSPVRRLDAVWCRLCLSCPHPPRSRPLHRRSHRREWRSGISIRLPDPARQYRDHPLDRLHPGHPRLPPGPSLPRGGSLGHCRLHQDLPHPPPWRLPGPTLPRTGRPFLTGISTAVLTTVAALWYVGPSIGVASRGFLQGIQGFQGSYAQMVRTGEIGFDHSLFSVVKLAAVLYRILCRRSPPPVLFRGRRHRSPRLFPARTTPPLPQSPRLRHRGLHSASACQATSTASCISTLPRLFCSCTQSSPPRIPKPSPVAPAHRTLRSRASPSSSSRLTSSSSTASCTPGRCRRFCSFSSPRWQPSTRGRDLRPAQHTQQLAPSHAPESVISGNLH